LVGLLVTNKREGIDLVTDESDIVSDIVRYDAKIACDTREFELWWAKLKEEFTLQTDNKNN